MEKKEKRRLKWALVSSSRECLDSGCIDPFGWTSVDLYATRAQAESAICRMRDYDSDIVASVIMIGSANYE